MQLYSNITYVSSIYVVGIKYLVAGIGLYGYTELTQLLVSSPFIVTIPISFFKFSIILIIPCLFTLCLATSIQQTIFSGAY